MTPPPPRAPRPEAATPGVGVALWHVTGLTAWVVAQPLFSVLQQHPAWLIAHRVDATSILALVVAALALVPVLTLVSAALISALMGARIACAFARGAVGALTGFALWTLARQGLGPSLPNAAFLALAAAAVATAAWTATRWQRLPALRTFLTALLPGVVLFPLAFVLREPVRTLLWPADMGSADMAPADMAPAGMAPAGLAPLGGRQTHASIEPVSDRAPLVVFVLLDELPLLSLLDPNLHIDAGRFPGFARWAALGTWYRNATTVADATAQAVPALLTGRLPRAHATPTRADHPDNLFTHVRAAGLPLHVLETQTALAPPASPRDDMTIVDATATAVGAGPSAVATLLADAAAVSLALALPPPLHARLGLPRVDRGWRDAWRRGPPAKPSVVDGLPVPPTLQRLFAGLEARPEGLHFAHLLLPHVPWERLPSGARYDGAEIPGLLNHLWTGDAWLIAQAYQRHLLQVGYVDALLDALANRLGALGRLDDALVIIAADHGVAFLPHQPWRRVNRHNVTEIANVPLLIKRPGQRDGDLDDRPVETIDVLPTVLARLGLQAGTVDGHDLDDPNWSDHRAGAPRHCFVARLRVPATRVALPTDWQARRTARVAWKHANVGTGDLFAIGPHANLIGRPIADLATAAPGSRGRVALDARDTDARSLPIRLAGTLAHPGHAPEDSDRDDGSESVTIVIAIDGVIRASTRTHTERGAVRFSAMLDPRLTDRTPSPTITLHRVVETTSGPRQIPLASSWQPRRPSNHP